MSSVAAAGSDGRRGASSDGDALHERLHREVITFLAERDVELRVDVPDAAELVELTGEFVRGGKNLRSTFAYLGWRTRAPDSRAALRAAASLELLHAFALMQDDVMDESTTRRGRPSTHHVLQRRHAGLDRRFGESAATVLADLCLVWSEQMLRTSGLAAADLQRAAGCFDAMRQELAVGQYLDLLYTHRDAATSADALRVALLKSARYTVTRPLQLGATLAGGDGPLLEGLARYGDEIGLAFQIRDDILGAVGESAVTGKPVGDDLRAGKRTTVVAAALERADPQQKRILTAMLDGEASASDDEIVEVVAKTGAIAHLENTIADHLTRAEEALRNTDIPPSIATELRNMATRCANRVS